MTTKRILGLIILAIGSLFFAVDGYHAQQRVLRSFDFKPVYSGARCLLDHCNPYDSDQIKQEYLSHGGDPSDLRPFRIYNANYPPSALFLAIPFALFHWPAAHLLWLTFSVSIMIVAAFLMADLCAAYSPLGAVSLVGIFMGTSVILIMLAQPAMLSIGFCLIAVWCLLRDRFPWLAILCFAISLTMKPHVGGLIWLYFLLSGTARYRVRAIQIFVATVVLCLPGILWASLTPQSAHWMRDLHVNLVGIAAHGNASDPGPANTEAPGIASLQAVVSVFRDDPHFYNPVTWGFIGILLLLWLYPTWKMRPSIKKDLLALAAIGCLALLPIYHRQYDTRLLLLTFPALALLLSEKKIAGAVGFVLSISVIVATSTFFDRFIGNHVMSHVMHPGLLLTVGLRRDVPLAVLVTGLFYLWCYLNAFWKEGQQTAEEAQGHATGSMAHA